MAGAAILSALNCHQDRTRRDECFSPADDSPPRREREQNHANNRRDRSDCNDETDPADEHDRSFAGQKSAQHSSSTAMSYPRSLR